jgi:hypothetical protein
MKISEELQKLRQSQTNLKPWDFEDNRIFIRVHRKNSKDYFDFYLENEQDDERRPNGGNDTRFYLNKIFDKKPLYNKAVEFWNLFKPEKENSIYPIFKPIDKYPMSEVNSLKTAEDFVDALDQLTSTELDDDKWQQIIDDYLNSNIGWGTLSDTVNQLLN